MALPKVRYPALFTIDPHGRRGHIHYPPTDTVYSVDDETYAQVRAAAPVAPAEDLEPEEEAETELLAETEAPAPRLDWAALVAKGRALGMDIPDDETETEENRAQIAETIADLEAAKKVKRAR